MRDASLWRSGAERADCPSVLGLAPASRNSLRALQALRSDKRDENDDERASRGNAAFGEGLTQTDSLLTALRRSWVQTLF